MQQTNQLNIEYLFLQLYNLIFGARGGLDYAAFAAFLAHVWLWIIGIGYALSLAAFFAIIYCLMRLFELRRREEAYYGTLLLAPESVVGENPRWKHIQSLMESDNPSSWREAIIEADIMLDDMLDRQGYKGDGVGDKLKSVEPSDFNTLEDAWEAHKVRNQIAHQGSGFDLSETVARRTIARFEAVFREFEAI